MNISHMARLHGRGPSVADMLEAEKPRVDDKAGLPRINMSTYKKNAAQVGLRQVTRVV